MLLLGSPSSSQKRQRKALNREGNLKIYVTWAASPNDLKWSYNCHGRYIIDSRVLVAAHLIEWNQPCVCFSATIDIHQPCPWVQLTFTIIMAVISSRLYHWAIWHQVPLTPWFAYAENTGLIKHTCGRRQSCDFNSIASNWLHLGPSMNPTPTRFGYDSETSNS